MRIIIANGRSCQREFRYLSKHYDLNKIEKVIVVGAGAIPYTAILFSKNIDKPIYAIEKNALAYFACLRLVQKLKIKKIKVVRSSGQLYCDYDNSLVIISLHVLPKQKVLERVLSSNKRNQIVLIRQPLDQNMHLFDSVSLDGLDCSTIEHNTPPLFCLSHLCQTKKCKMLIRK